MSPIRIEGPEFNCGCSSRVWTWRWRVRSTSVEMGRDDAQLLAEPAERVVALLLGLEGAEHLLERDHIGIELGDHESRPGDLGLAPVIDALPAMDVVGRSTHGFGHDDQGYRPSGARDEAQMQLDRGSEGHSDPIARLAAEIPNPDDGGFTRATCDLESGRGRLRRTIARPRSLRAHPLDGGGARSGFSLGLLSRSRRHVSPRFLVCGAPVVPYRPQLSPYLRPARRAAAQ